MHVKRTDGEFNFDGNEPEGIDVCLHRRPEAVVPFLKYMLGLDMDSEEYKKLKNYWIQGGWLKAGYFKALSDVQEYWKRYKQGIRYFKLSGYDGVEFMLEKLNENRHKLFYLDSALDMEFTDKEVEDFKLRKKDPKKWRELNRGKDIPIGEGK